MDLALRDITHSFGTKRALESLSFDLPSGMVTGFVGNNGAGKSTAIRVLIGLISADAGHVLADGRPITEEARRRIGYVPEERGLYQQDKVFEQLMYIARTFGLSKERASFYVKSGLSQFGIEKYADHKLGDLSLGNQQRVQIICSLLGDPDALVLDEPFSGLDPQAVSELADILRVIARSGKPVLFSSHQLDVVEDVSDRVIFIQDGQVLAEDLIENLTGQRKFHVAFEDSYGVHQSENAETPTQLTELIHTIQTQGFSIIDVTSEKRGLIQVFREHSSHREEVA